MRARRFNLDKVAERVCGILGLNKSELWAAGKNRNRVRVRSLFCYWASSELGISQAKLSRKFEISPAAVTLSLKREQEIVTQQNYSLFQLTDFDP